MSDLSVELQQTKPYNPLDREQFIAECKAAGKRMVFPSAQQLQIDIDTEEQYKVFQANYDRFLSYNPDEGVQMVETVSGSGLPHRHITLTLNWELESEWQRIALQAVLGSDPVREILSAMRVLHGVENPTMFVEPK